jgi:hypothetical protein
MQFPAHQQKLALMFLGTFAVVSLMFTSWAMIRLSSWVVFHDSAGSQMTQEHDAIDSFLAEAFFLCRDGSWLLVLEFVCGVFFLGLLWRRLYRPDSHDAD